MLAMNTLVVIAGEYLIFAIILTAVITGLFSEKAVRNKLAVLAIISLLLASAGGWAAGALYYNERPFVVEHSVPLIPHSPDNGFPSDHTLYAATIAATVFVYHRKTGAILGLLAIAVGVARVAAGIHHPIDIIGALALAIAATFAAWLLTRALAKRKGALPWFPR